MATIAATCTKTIVDHAIVYGLDPYPALRRFGIGEVTLADRNGRIPLDAHHQVWDWATAELEDPDLGLHLAERTASAASLGLVGHLARCSPTIGAAITAAHRHARLFKEDGRLTFTAHDRTGTVTEGPDKNEPAWPRVRTDAILCTYLVLTRAWTREPIMPIEARFQHSRPRDVSELERVFGCPLRFDQPDNAVVLSRETLEVCLLTADDDTLRSLGDVAAARLASLGGRSFIDQVRITVSEGLIAQPPSIQRVARRLAVSTRSLQRQLGSNGTSFRDVVDAVRQQQAIALLRNGVSLQDIAEQLGFSEVRAFRRAFRRWTGQPPSRWSRPSAALPSS